MEMKGKAVENVEQWKFAKFRNFLFSWSLVSVPRVLVHSAAECLCRRMCGSAAGDSTKVPDEMPFSFRFFCVFAATEEAKCSQSKNRTK